MKKLLDTGKIALWAPFAVAIVVVVVTFASAWPHVRDYGLLEVPFHSWYVFVSFAVLIAVPVVIVVSLRRRLGRQVEEKEEEIRCLKKQLQEQRIPFIVGLEHLAKARPEFLPIIQRLFITVNRIESIDITPLLGGYSGSITFVARIKLENEVQWLPEPFVLKLGVKREMKDEEEKWKRYIENRFFDAPRAIKYETLGDYAGASYTFAGLGGEIQNFHSFCEGRSHTEIEEVIQELYRKMEAWRKGWGEGIKEITDINLYDEYHLLHKKNEEIIEGIHIIVDRDDPYHQNFYASPALLAPGLKPQFCEDLLQIDEHWCDPVYFIRTWQRRGLTVPFYKSVVHGDLRAGNILVELRHRKAWLIDFSHTGNGLSQERIDEALHEGRPIDPDRGHVLRDFCRLEADIKFVLTALENPDDFNKAFLFEKELMACGLDLDSLTRRSQRPEALRDSRFEKAWECIREIRRLAKEYLCQSNELRPYYLSLLHTTLPIVYYKQCSEWQKKYALISAGMLCGRLTS